jgi:hypothetical protein
VHVLHVLNACLKIVMACAAQECLECRPALPHTYHAWHLVDVEHDWSFEGLAR